MIGKVFVWFLVFVAVATAFNVDFVRPIPRRDEHNIVQCDPASNPDEWQLVYRETVIKDAVFLGYVEATINYPEGGIGQNEIICIIVTDLVGDGNGGYPTITEGGMNSNHVTIHMKSQFSKGFGFIIEIYIKKQ